MTGKLAMRLINKAYDDAAERAWGQYAMTNAKMGLLNE